MPETIKPLCPVCGEPIIDTRTDVQHYDDFDDYAGYRCSGCKQTFTDEEITVLMNKPSA